MRVSSDGPIRRIPICLATTTTRNPGPPNLPSPGRLGFPTRTLVVCRTTKRERTFSAASLIHTRQNASFPGAAVALGPTPAFRAQLPRRPIYGVRSPSHPPRHLLTTLFWLLSSLDSLQAACGFTSSPSVPNFWSGSCELKDADSHAARCRDLAYPEARTLFCYSSHTYISFVLGLCYYFLAQYPSLC